jgi:GDPmannose 4,6-dehydratase
MYGKIQEVPQTENTPFYPRSPYGVAKLYAHWITKNYREAYKLHASSGILFNHESPRRGETFVTRKITIGLNKILKGEIDCLVLGNIDAKRDWGHAKDYVRGMWMMLQQDEPGDYVVSTGIQHSITDLLNIGFNHVGIVDWKKHIESDPRFKRPAELHSLCGNSSKAKKILGWQPKTNFETLIKEMVDADVKRYNK